MPLAKHEPDGERNTWDTWSKYLLLGSLQANINAPVGRLAQWLARLVYTE